jgi:ATP-binding cassette subfamily C protein
MTFGLQAVGNVTEGLSVILLLPLFQFIGKGGSGTLLHLPTGFLAPLLGPAFNIELWIVLCVFVILIVLIALFNKFKTVYAAELFSQTINSIRTDLFKSIARAQWFTIATMRKADLNHALTGDIDRVQVAITSLYSIGQNIVFFCLYFGLSALISLKMTAFASAAGLLVFLVQRPIRIYAASYGQRLTRQRQLIF